MAVRDSMADLIMRTRRLIQDPAGDDQVWTDQDVQDYLDAHRDDIRYMQLRAGQTITATGGIVFLDYYAPQGDWEADALLYDPTFHAITTASADYLVGHWVLATNQYPPVFLVGKTYDVYAAAADLLEVWAAQLKLEYDFQTADQQKFSRSQRSKALLDLAGIYRRKQRPIQATLTRLDTC